MGGGEGRGRPGPHKQREASVLGGRVVEVAERDCLLQGPVTPSPSARTSQGARKKGPPVLEKAWRHPAGQDRIFSRARCCSIWSSFLAGALCILQGRAYGI